MAKKNTKKTKVNKPKKVLVIPIEKHEATDNIGQALAAMESLQASVGWALIVRILNDNIAYLQQAIIDKYDPISKRELSESECDEFRTKVGLNKELRDTPQRYSQLIKDTNAVPKDYDPYYKSKAELDRG